MLLLCALSELSGRGFWFKKHEWILRGVYPALDPQDAVHAGLRITNKKSAPFGTLLSITIVSDHPSELLAAVLHPS
jgi:hypothetical protein